MPKFDIESTHHQPRVKTKGKRHQRGFNEDIQDNRAQRVNFKKYIQQLEEEELENFDDYDEDYE